MLRSRASRQLGSPSERVVGHVRSILQAAADRPAGGAAPAAAQRNQVDNFRGQSVNSAQFRISPPADFVSRCLPKLRYYAFGS